MKPIMLTGINQVAQRGDLLERSLLIELPSISTERRRSEKKFWEEFERVRPQILGALLDAVAVAFENLPSVRVDQLPRMADFAEWVTAAEPALGLETGQFMQAYQENQTIANDLALESSFLTRHLQDLIEKGEWSGTWGELLAVLQRTLEGTLQARLPPDSPKALW